MSLLICTGTAQKYNWQEAFTAVEQLNTQNHLGYNDWQLPHIEDFYSLIYCSAGFERTGTIPRKTGGSKTVKRWCKGSGYQQPTINKQVFSKMPQISPLYWSSSPYANDSNDAWIVDFHYGGHHDYYNKNNDYHVRAVRSVN